MERGRTGGCCRSISASGRVRTLAAGLRYAFGACAAGDDAARQRKLAASRRRHCRRRQPSASCWTICRSIPRGFRRRVGGGFWLTAFAARTQLVEFVLRENAYRRRMMAEIEPEYWIAPAPASGQSFLEPMQGAHLKTMGVVKPWAPPRSYGLVIRLERDGAPLYSLHSRVDGINHGVVAAVEMDGDAVS